MLACCDAEKHQWEVHDVERRWVPRVLRCLIVGENPGDTASQYFYKHPTNYASDAVVVRRALLCGLHKHLLIPEPTLEGFHKAGFLFDHAIRCQLPPRLVNAERQKAMRYASRRVEDPMHLRPLLAQASVIWVMGHLANNAVANAIPELPRQRRRVSMTPYPGGTEPSSKFFLSEYLTWRNEADAPRFCQAFLHFAREKAVFDDI